MVFWYLAFYVDVIDHLEPAYEMTHYSDFNSKESPSGEFFVTNSEPNKTKRASDHGCDKVVTTLGNNCVGIILIRKTLKVFHD